MFLLLITFIAGVLTVLAPCILPVLPVIIGGSLAGNTDASFNKKKAFTIIISLGLSVIAFTLLLKASTLFINIPEYVWKWFSGGIVLILGLVTFFPSLLDSEFLATLNAKSNELMGKGFQKKNFWGDVIIGASLGPVFSTCSPTYFIVLATVLPISPIKGLTYMFSYVIGLCLSLLFISIVGQKIVNKLGIVADPNGWFKKFLGVVFIIVGIAIIGGLDKKFQLYILDKGFFDITKVEQKLLQKNEDKTVALPEDEQMEENTNPASSVSNTQTNNSKNEGEFKYLTLEQKKSKFRKVNELSTIDGYINTGGKQITLESLRGKVVLLDIWTYSCINCQRTIPYIVKWYKKYKDQGLEIVGLHTPEFSFEKVQSNVEKAVKNFGIEYPVVMDNDFSTWNALGNQYWPRKYLIDIDGYIIYDHIGEGNYEETEAVIQDALREKAYRDGKIIDISNSITDQNDVVTVDTSKVKSPEVYFGSNRNEFLANGKRGQSGEQTFITPSSLSTNLLYLSGNWNITPEYAENVGPAEINFKYESKNVYMASGSSEGVKVSIYIDGIFVKEITIKDEQLYSLIEGVDYAKHTLKIVIPRSGLKAFTFTFG